MSQLLGALAVVLIVLVVVSLAGAVLEQRNRPRRPSHRLVQQFRATDQSIAREHLAARRAMNRAAGQSWRNYVE